MNSRNRRGVTRVEVVIAGVVILMIAAVVVMAIPRSRESARLASCRRNLMLIGQAVSYYDGAAGHLPTVPAPGQAGTAPLPTMLGMLGLGDFSPLADPNAKLPKRPQATIPDHFIAGLTCPSDPNLRSSRFVAPTSYRVNAGANADGTGGPFSPGAVVSLADIERGDGQDFTAGFSERLLGSGPNAPSELNDYRVVPGPLGAAPAKFKAAAPWRTDAGASWSGTGWSSTLYNHAITPGFAPSLIAGDGRSAFMGASSGHGKQIHVLLLGGSVRGFTPSVDPDVWRRFGTLSDPVSQGPEP